MQNKKGIYIAIIVGLLTLISACSFFIYYFYDASKSNLFANRLVYRENTYINNHVLLKDDKFFNQTTSANEAYVTNLMSKISSSFNYNLSFSDTVKGNYNYYIAGHLIVNVNESKDNILAKEVYRSEMKKENINGSILNINDNFVIDAESIYETYQDFKKNYTTKLNAQVRFDIYINYDLFNEIINRNINTLKILTISYSLDDETTKIKVSPVANGEETIYQEIGTKDKKIYFIICLEFAGAILLFIIIIMIIVHKLIILKSVYEENLRNILKKYAKYIINLKEVPDLKDMTIYFVEDFYDVLDVAKQINKPIIFNEVIKKREAVFIVIDNYQAYVYKLSKINM